MCETELLAMTAFPSSTTSSSINGEMVDPAGEATPQCATFAFSLSFVAVGFTCGFGFVGNSLAIATLCKDHSLQKSVTTFLLSVLAVADLAFLLPVVVVIMIPSYCAYYRSVCALPVLRAIPYIEQYGWAAASSTHMLTVYLTVLVALHRYVYVCRPEDNGRYSGHRRAKIHVALVIAFAFVYNLPRIFEYRLLPVSRESEGKENLTQNIGHVWKVPGENGTSCWKRMVFTEVGGSIWFQIVYKNVCFYLFMYLIPLALLVMVSIRLLQALRRRKHVSARSPLNCKQQKRDDNVTFVLVIVIVLFIVCQTPTVVQRLALALSGSEGLACGHPYYYIERSADYLAVLNTSLNFVVYVMFARSFRHILLTEVLRLRRNGATGNTGAQFSSEMNESYRLSSGNAKDPAALLLEPAVEPVTGGEPGIAQDQEHS